MPDLDIKPQQVTTEPRLPKTNGPVGELIGPFPEKKLEPTKATWVQKTWRKLDTWKRTVGGVMYAVGMVGGKVVPTMIWLFVPMEVLGGLMFGVGVFHDLIKKTGNGQMPTVKEEATKAKDLFTKIWEFLKQIWPIIQKAFFKQ